MSQTKPDAPSRVDQILDLLLDALLERQRARGERPLQPPEAPAESTATEPFAVEPPLPEPGPEPGVEKTEVAEEVEPQQLQDLLPSPLLVPPGQMGRTLFRLAVGLLLFVVLVNVPITRHGVSLARVMPDSAALVIRNGLLLKSESSDEIYVLQDDRLRWISSLEAFERLGYRWRDVHVVEESFLDRFEKGRPVHVLLKCKGSPHIYRIEREQKRWIKDIPTFEAEGHVWEDVRFVSCQYLRNLPDGPPIPEDAGPPPQP
ncbi:MAG: hypothetical protein JSV36_13985 [Anaerolineae bacterium]|nr:MAG: hypothetical protein JSV36_13985 [Anaerolineae bacterium]